MTSVHQDDSSGTAGTLAPHPIGSRVAFRSPRLLPDRGATVSFAVAGVVVQDDADVIVVVTGWDGTYDVAEWGGLTVVRAHPVGTNWSVWRWHDGNDWTRDRSILGSVVRPRPSSWRSSEARPGTSSVLPCSSSSRGVRASTRPGAIQRCRRPMKNPRGPVPSTHQRRSEATGMRNSSATSSMVSSASMRSGSRVVRSVVVGSVG